MKIENDIYEVMFTSELDNLVISGCGALGTIHFQIVDEAYQYTECELVLTADRKGNIVVARFAELLNSVIWRAPGRWGFHVKEYGWLLSAYLIPAEVMPRKPAAEYIRESPLTTVRGKKTIFGGHPEYMPVVLTQGEWTVYTEVRYGEGGKLSETRKESTKALYEVRELLIMHENLFEQLYLPVPDYYTVKVTVTGPDDGQGQHATIEMEYEVIRKPFGGRTFYFDNGFNVRETIAIAAVSRKSRPEHKTAMIGGRKTTYEIVDNTEYNLISYPLGDGEEDGAADFLRSRKIVDSENYVEYIIKEGELKVSTAQNEMIRVEATIEQTERLQRFNGDRPNVFDDTFDDTFN